MIYFIQNTDTGYIKIGFSKDVDRRLAALRSEHGQNLIVLGACKGAYYGEQELHERFAAHRVTGEWFAPNPELDTYIKENTTSHTRSTPHEITSNEKVVAKTFVYNAEYDEIQEYARARGISIADLLRDALREHLRRNGVKLPLLVRRGKRLPD